MFENSAYIDGRSQKQLAFTTSAAQTPLLDVGIYAVWSDVDCYIKTDSTDASGVTTSTGFIVRANAPVLPLRLSKPSRIGAIGAASGTLSYHQFF